MAQMQHFRYAFRGFNKEDVVHYIEYMNNQHNQQLAQLQNQLQNAQAATDLSARLEAAETRCAQLEAELAQLRSVEPAVPTTADAELEAYRRAERAERQAQERAQQLYTQANAVLSDVTLKAETASKLVTSVADQISDKLQATKDALQEAVAALYSIRPEK